MSDFIEITTSDFRDDDGNPIIVKSTINTKNIIEVKDSTDGAGCLMLLSWKSRFYTSVHETYEEIQKLLNASTMRD